MVKSKSLRKKRGGNKGGQKRADKFPNIQINIDGGVNSGQSGLTTAKTYYVAPTGILTTTAATPSVVTGTSISDTKIIVWLEIARKIWYNGDY